MMFVLHHLALVGLIAGITVFCVYFPALALKWRSTLVAIVLCALFAQWIFDKATASQAKQTAKVEAKLQTQTTITKQQAITAKVVDHYIDRIQVVHDQGATIIKQVTKYVPANACPMPGSFGLLFNAGATGLPIPDTAGFADAAPIAAQDVASATVEDFTIARTNAEQLTALQDWIRQQQDAAK